LKTSTGCCAALWLPVAPVQVRRSLPLHACYRLQCMAGLYTYWLLKAVALPGAASVVKQFPDYGSVWIFRLLFWWADILNGKHGINIFAWRQPIPLGRLQLCRTSTTMELNVVLRVLMCTWKEMNASCAD
jgi:hypothetical protein